MKIAKDWIIRDYLAAERTDLAIDRTLLSYIRTGMTITVVGISLIKLFSEKYFHSIGFILIYAAVIIIIIGFLRTNELRKILKEKFK